MATECEPGMPNTCCTPCRTRPATRMSEPLGLMSVIRLVFLAQDGRGDLELQDLVGALIQPADPHVLQVARDAKLLEEAAPAKHLHSAVGGVPGSLRGVELRLRNHEVGP